MKSFKAVVSNLCAISEKSRTAVQNSSKDYFEVTPLVDTLESNKEALKTQNLAVLGALALGLSKMHYANTQRFNDQVLAKTIGQNLGNSSEHNSTTNPKNGDDFVYWYDYFFDPQYDLAASVSESEAFLTQFIPSYNGSRNTELVSYQRVNARMGDLSVNLDSYMNNILAHFSQLQTASEQQLANLRHEIILHVRRSLNEHREFEYVVTEPDETVELTESQIEDLEAHLDEIVPRCINEGHSTVRSFMQSSVATELTGSDYNEEGVYDDMDSVEFDESQILLGPQRSNHDDSDDLSDPDDLGGLREHSHDGLSVSSNLPQSDIEEEELSLLDIETQLAIGPPPIVISPENHLNQTRQFHYPVTETGLVAIQPKVRTPSNGVIDYCTVNFVPSQTEGVLNAEIAIDHSYGPGELDLEQEIITCLTIDYQVRVYTESHRTGPSPKRRKRNDQENNVGNNNETENNVGNNNDEDEDTFATIAPLLKSVWTGVSGGLNDQQQEEEEEEEEERGTVRQQPPLTSTSLQQNEDNNEIDAVMEGMSEFEVQDIPTAIPDQLFVEEERGTVRQQPPLTSTSLQQNEDNNEIDAVMEGMSEFEVQDIPTAIPDQLFVEEERGTVRQQPPLTSTSLQQNEDNNEIDSVMEGMSEFEVQDIPTAIPDQLFGLDNTVERNNETCALTTVGRVFSEANLSELNTVRAVEGLAADSIEDNQNTNASPIRPHVSNELVPIQTQINDDRSAVIPLGIEFTTLEHATVDDVTTAVPLEESGESGDLDVLPRDEPIISPPSSEDVADTSEYEPELITDFSDEDFVFYGSSSNLEVSLAGSSDFPTETESNYLFSESSIRIRDYIETPKKKGLEEPLGRLSDTKREVIGSPPQTWPAVLSSIDPHKRKLLVDTGGQSLRHFRLEVLAIIEEGNAVPLIFVYLSITRLNESPVNYGEFLYGILLMAGEGFVYLKQANNLEIPNPTVWVKRAIASLIDNGLDSSFAGVS